MKDLERTIRSGVTVGLWSGASVGVLLAIRLVTLPVPEPIFAGLPDVLRGGLVLASGLALTGALVTGLITSLLEAILRLARWRRPRDPMRLSFGVAVAGVLFVYGFFNIGFNLTRDLTGSRGLTLLALNALVAAAVLLCGVLWSQRGEFEHRPWHWSWLGLCAALLTAVLVVGPPAPERAPLPQVSSSPAATKPSAAASASGPVILISIDTLRADHLGSHGYERDTTPHLDALARDGFRFARAQSQAPWTLPAHATMMTGLYPSSHGAQVYNNIRFLNPHVTDVLSEEHTTLAEILQGAGWTTGAIVNVPWLGKGFGVDQGFERRVRRPGNGSATAVVDLALEWLDESTPPTFLFLHVFDVHDYHPRGEFIGRWSDADYDGPLKKRLRSLMVNRYDSLSEPDLGYAIDVYDEALRYVDHEFARLFAALEAKGLYESSLIVVTADHGEEFWEHHGTGHGFTLYDEVLGVPLIIKPPGGSGIAPGVSGTPVGLVDVMPTMLELIGLPAPHRAQGVSLVRHMRDGAPLQERQLFAEATYTMASHAVMDEEWKYIEHGSTPMRLFDPRYAIPTIRALFNLGSPQLFRIDGESGDEREACGEACDTVFEHPEIAKAFRASVRRHLAGSTEATTSAHDEQEIEELKALGYIR